MDQVGILLRVHAASTEPDLPLCLIHAVHATHHPGAVRDRVFDAATMGVDQVEMAPAVALGAKDQLATAIGVVEVKAGVEIDEGFLLLIDEAAHLAAAGVHLKQAKTLMRALAALDGKGFAIGIPAWPRRAPP